jgi:RNA polymerase sigma factor (sigma-70 family)
LIPVKSFIKERFMAVEPFPELPPNQVAPTQQLYDRLLKSVEYRYTIEKIARKNTRGTSLSWEDAAQTAHEKIVLAIQSNKFQYGGVDEFYRWSATIAHCTVIDLVRREKLRHHSSLDASIPNTDTPLVDTIADPLNLWEAVEQAELCFKINAVIQKLDQQYPERGYLKLWEAKILGKRQTQIAVELNIKQGTVSKRWKELVQAVATTLELLETTMIHQKLNESRESSSRDRSKAQWLFSTSAIDAHHSH